MYSLLVYFGLCGAHPDVELNELATALREACNVTVSLSTLHRELSRHGLSRKKVSPTEKLTTTSGTRYTDAYMLQG